MMKSNESCHRDDLGFGVGVYCSYGNWAADDSSLGILTCDCVGVIC